MLKCQQYQPQHEVNPHFKYYTSNTVYKFLRFWGCFYFISSSTSECMCVCMWIRCGFHKDFLHFAPLFLMYNGSNCMDSIRSALTLWKPKSFRLLDSKTENKGKNWRRASVSVCGWMLLRNSWYTNFHQVHSRMQNEQEQIQQEFRLNWCFHWNTI